MATIIKSGDVWRVQVKKHGVRDSGTFNTKNEAVLWAAQREAEIEGKVFGKAPDGATFGDALTKYRDEVTPDKKARKWETNKINFILTLPLAKIRLDRLAPMDFYDWQKLRRRSVKDATVLRERTVINSVIETAIKPWRWMAENPLLEVDRPPEAQPRRRLATDEEMEQIIEALGYRDSEPPVSTSARVGLAVRWAAETAMRAGEICKLKWENVDVAKRVAVIPRDAETGKADTKTDAERRVPLSSAALRMIEQLRPLTGAGERMFDLSSSSLDTLFRRARDKLGIKDLHFHDLRANALTRLAKKVDVMALSRISGHKDINELLTYYRETEEEIALRLD